MGKKKNSVSSAVDVGQVNEHEPPVGSELLSKVTKNKLKKKLGKTTAVPEVDDIVTKRKQKKGQGKSVEEEDFVEPSQPGKKKSTKPSKSSQHEDHQDAPAAGISDVSNDEEKQKKKKRAKSTSFQDAIDEPLVAPQLDTAEEEPKKKTLKQKKKARMDASKRSAELLSEEAEVCAEDQPEAIQPAKKAKKQKKPAKSHAGVDECPEEIPELIEPTQPAKKTRKLKREQGEAAVSSKKKKPASDTDECHQPEEVQSSEAPPSHQLHDGKDKVSKKETRKQRKEEAASIAAAEETVDGLNISESCQNVLVPQKQRGKTKKKEPAGSLPVVETVVINVDKDGSRQVKAVTVTPEQAAQEVAEMPSSSQNSSTAQCQLELVETETAILETVKTVKKVTERAVAVRVPDKQLAVVQYKESTLGQVPLKENRKRKSDEENAAVEVSHKKQRRMVNAESIGDPQQPLPSKRSQREREVAENDRLRELSLTRLETFFETVFAINFPGEAKILPQRIKVLLKAKEVWEVPYVDGGEVPPFPRSKATPRTFLVDFHDSSKARIMLGDLWGATIDEYSVSPFMVSPFDVMFEELLFDNDKLPHEANVEKLKKHFPSLVKASPGRFPGTDVLHFPNSTDAMKAFKTFGRRVFEVPVCAIFNYSCDHS